MVNCQSLHSLPHT